MKGQTDLLETVLTDDEGYYRVFWSHQQLSRVSSAIVLLASKEVAGHRRLTKTDIARLRRLYAGVRCAGLRGRGVVVRLTPKTRAGIDAAMIALSVKCQEEEVA
jgi:hypothetical protein